MTVRGEVDLETVTVGPVQRLDGAVQLVPYDPAWPVVFRRLARHIRRAMGDRVRLLEHVGSTSVPGLAAKPRIDILLAVSASADEDGYVPALERLGYVLRIREPDWNEHRCLVGAVPAQNLHVFTVGSPEIDRMLAFRDRLRTHPDERELYQRTKLELAARNWEFMQQYADAKTEVVEAIIARAGAGTEATPPT